MYSEYDDKGELYVDCTECERGRRGSDEDKCSFGFKVKKHHVYGCFSGHLLKSLKKGLAK